MGDSEWSLPPGTWLQKEDRPKGPKAVRDPGERRLFLGSCKAIGSEGCLGTSSTSITRELVRNTNSRPMNSRPRSVRNPGREGAPVSCVRTIPPGDSEAHSNVRTIVLEKKHQNHLEEFFKNINA